MNTITLRKAQLSDQETIARFNEAMALETESKTLDATTIRAGVGRVLSDDQHGFYLVAEAEQQLVACLMVTYEWSDWRCARIWWIQSVYVIEAYRRHGIYRQMYTHLKQMAHEIGGVCGFRLYVEKENHRAQKTYASLGMEQCVYDMYEQMEA